MFSNGFHFPHALLEREPTDLPTSSLIFLHHRGLHRGFFFHFRRQEIHELFTALVRIFSRSKSSIICSMLFLIRVCSSTAIFPFFGENPRRNYFFAANEAWSGPALAPLLVTATRYSRSANTNFASPGPVCSVHHLDQETIRFFAPLEGTR